MVSAVSPDHLGVASRKGLLFSARNDSSSAERTGRNRAAGPGARKWIAVLSLAVIVLGWAGAAAGAEVRVKGQDLEGSVVGVTSEGVEFETIYGKGTVLIPWHTVERIRSDKEFLILHGDDEKTVGRIWGLEDSDLLVGKSIKSAIHIPVDRIYRSLTREQYEHSRLEALRARYRYWKGSFDLGFAYTQATTDTTQFSTKIELQRKKKPTDFLFSASYRYGTTKEKGKDRTVDENVVFGRSRLDRDLRDRVFAFASITGEYNEVESLSIRTDPTVGLGYRFIDRPDLSLSGRSGPGYVYQRYFNGGTDDYFTILFGGDLDAGLPYDSRLKVSAEYLPSVTAWQQSYVIRATADWTMPILGWLDFKLSILDTYNNKPAEDTDRNSFTTLAGLSLRF